MAVAALEWNVEATGTSGPQQVVGHRLQGEPGRVGVEMPGRQLGQRPGLAVCDDLLDHGVVAVFPLGLQRGGGLGNAGCY